MPCAWSSAIFLLVASGIGGRLVRLPCALARAIPAFTRSPISALSNWARLAIMPNTSSPSESRGGISPPRAPRTVREPLDSYGSQHPAATVQKRPVGEEPGLSPDQLRQPSASATWTLLEPLELASHPPEDMRIDPAQGRIERRLVEVAEVVDPPTDVLIEHPGYVEQPLVAAPLKTPATHRVPDGFQSLRTRRRQERDPIEPAPPLRQPRPECVAEKVEADTVVLAGPVGVLAVDQLGLPRVEHQTARGEPLVDGAPQLPRLAFAPAVADDVVRVTLERDARHLPPDPEIERVVQEEVGQQGRDDPALRRPPVPRDKIAPFEHRGRFQPALDVEE